MNGSITVTIHDSATNAALASATIDQMWGFAIGQNTWSADGYELMPVAEVPPGVPKVPYLACKGGAPPNMCRLCRIQQHQESACV